jgi:hypothetical protein
MCNIWCNSCKKTRSHTKILNKDRYSKSHTAQQYAIMECEDCKAPTMEVHDWTGPVSEDLGPTFAGTYYFPSRNKEHHIRKHIPISPPQVLRVYNDIVDLYNIESYISASMLCRLFVEVTYLELYKSQDDFDPDSEWEKKVENKRIKQKFSLLEKSGIPNEFRLFFLSENNKYNNQTFLRLTNRAVHAGIPIPVDLIKEFIIHMESCIEILYITPHRSHMSDNAFNPPFKFGSYSLMVSNQYGALDFGDDMKLIHNNVVIIGKKTNGKTLLT